MIIAQVEPPQEKRGGDYYYRTFAPSVAMSHQHGVYVVNLTNVHRFRQQVFRQVDVLVLKNICDADFLPIIVAREKEGRITVYEMADDLAAIQPWNPVYFFYNNTENVNLTFRLAHQCNGTQFSVPYLRDLYNSLNARSRVFPNHIIEFPDEKERENNQDIVIGWGGSHGHLEDMKEVAPLLSRWIMSHPGAMLHLMCSEPIWALFQELPDDKKKRTKPGSIEEYYRFLGHIDIGIAPLQDTPFNRCRSDIKFLEYAATGVIPVMARCEPYVRSVCEGKTGYLFGGPKELVTILDRLAECPSSWKNLREAARQYVSRERRQLDHGKERIDFYKELFKEAGGRKDSRKSREIFESWAAQKEHSVEGRYLQLEDTDFERLLGDGLVYLQVDEDKERARACFEEAAALAPENYLSYLFGALCSPEPVEKLQKALQKNPTSLKAYMMLGDVLAQQGKAAKALQIFAKATQIFPDYDVPYLKAAALMERLGQQSDADLLFNQAKNLAIPL